MTYKSYPFASASLKVKETRLITKEKLLRIAESKTIAEAYKSLAETGYGLGEVCVDDFERLIKRELKSAYEYAAKIAPDENAFALYLLKTDYHNIKVLLKLLLKKEPLSSAALKENGTIAIDVLKTAVTDKKYDSLPPELKQALLALDRQFSVKEDVSLIGIYLDSAYARQARRIVKSVKDGFVKEYMSAFADFTNVISFIRLRLLEMGKEMLKKVFIPGGELKEKDFLDVYDVGLDSVSHYFARGGLQRPMNAAFEEFKKTGSLYAFEKARDDTLTGIIKKRKNEVFTIAPTIAYILAKEREADNIRLVMTAQHNQKDADFVTGRIKEMYS